MENHGVIQFHFHLYYSCTVKHMSYKMVSVSSFWCHNCACKFMLACIYHALFRVGGRVGDYLIYSPVAAKIVLLCCVGKMCGKI